MLYVRQKTIPTIPRKRGWRFRTKLELAARLAELKTGCAMESRQLKAATRLEAFVGLTSLVAIRLLQLKSIARTNPEVPAQRVVPRVWLQIADRLEAYPTS